VQCFSTPQRANISPEDLSALPIPSSPRIFHICLPMTAHFEPITVFPASRMHQFNEGSRRYLLPPRLLHASEPQWSQHETCLARRLPAYPDQIERHQHLRRIGHAIRKELCRCCCRKYLPLKQLQIQQSRSLSIRLFALTSGQPQLLKRILRALQLKNKCLSSFIATFYTSKGGDMIL
jgi:hypothetical protein